jgi:hypothetical protein
VHITRTRSQIEPRKAFINNSIMVNMRMFTARPPKVIASPVPGRNKIAFFKMIHEKMGNSGKELVERSQYNRNSEGNIRECAVPHGIRPQWGG